MGVWSPGSEAAIKAKAQKVFGSFHNNLLFIFPDDKTDRDLRRIWFNFPEFSVNNTFYMSSNPVQLLKEQESCFLPVLQFKGEPDDVVLQALESYLAFFLFKQMESKISSVPPGIGPRSFHGLRKHCAAAFQPNPIRPSCRCCQ